GVLPPRSVRSTSGIPNASVLPEPVGDFARTSRPASASGRTMVWIRKGSVKPRAASASWTCALTPSAPNDSDMWFYSLGFGFEIADSMHPKEEREANPTGRHTAVRARNVAEKSAVAVQQAGSAAGYGGDHVDASALGERRGQVAALAFDVHVDVT